MRRWLYENSLSIVSFFLFAVFLGGQIVTGCHEYNSERRDRGQPEVTCGAYLRSGHFVEATAENWESEFLQMGAYVLLTVWLRQKGSSESKKIDQPEPVDAEPDPRKKDAPWPVRRGGWVLWLYQHSLSIAFLLLFLLSFTLHAFGGAADYNEERAVRGEPPMTVVHYLMSSRFWFESFQNWQSEFLAVGSIVVLSIFLRQKGSPQSKPVDARHGTTRE